MTQVKPRTIKEILDVMTSKSSVDIDLVTRAYEFAEKAHTGQLRFSGDPYFSHVAEVGFYLAQAGLDAEAIAAGLLHDTIEDAHIDEDVFKKEFGDQVFMLVDGVTKLGKLRYQGTQRHTESLRKLFAATAKDIRVLIIKLMDRLHNARTLSHVPREDKRDRIAKETLEIYAPIADRLGMSVLKQELEDAAFPYAYPKEYEKTREILRARKHEDEKQLEKLEHSLKRELGEAGIRNFRTEARIKGAYSLFKKLERKKWDITQIYDILALRLIFPSIADCYSALGIIHAHWRPVPGKIKDYIANPKPNGYQSIHSTLYTGSGGALEVQLRTEAIHQEALYGIASHLIYKDRQFGIKNPQAGITWIRQFFPLLKKQTTDNHDSGISAVPNWINELAHGEEDRTEDNYIETLKEDFFSHRIFVFTPKGDAIDMPIDATPVDFAYAVHSQIGNHMSGVRVNNKMVSLSTTLKNGNVVEIITKPSAKPSLKWLEIAKTSMARKFIRTALAEQEAARR
ncbi:MAG: RelA/SpoT family protein [Candidatus Kaiserbacteria bacterium]|nr:RelA/SpoT family protein [Candidatus Kaiserbacteria bacterium]